MRQNFQSELSNLHNCFYKMGLSVHRSLREAARAYLNGDKEAARHVISNDHEINRQEQLLEQTSIEMIALQQPLSSDLRKIIAILKASADLERIGDHAVSLSKAALRLPAGGEGHERIRELLKEMMACLDDMMAEVLIASLQEDASKAFEIAEKDSFLDQTANQLQRLIIEEQKQEAELAERASCDLQAMMYLERIGDYITNMTEWIIYERTGEKGPIESSFVRTCLNQEEPVTLTGSFLVLRDLRDVLYYS